MRGLVGLVSLLLVLAVVGILAKQAMRPAVVALPPPSGGTTTTETVHLSGTPQQQTQQVQKALDAAALQSQQRLDSIDGAGR